MLRWFPGFKHASLSLNPIYFMTSSAQNNQAFTAKVLTDFVLITSHYQSHDSSFNSSSTNCIGVLDNSNNVHLLCDNRLFAGDIQPQGIGRENCCMQIIIKKHPMTLEESLCYPLSPANMINVKKLDLDREDATLNMQTFSSSSVFTWNKGESSISFKHSTSDFPELNIISSFSPLTFLTTHLKDSSIRLSKQDQLQLFEHASKMELHNLINSSPLSDLQWEHVVNHHRLKFMSHVNMLHLIQLGHFPQRLAKVKPSPCLACLLGKSRRWPWISRATHKHIRNTQPRPPGSSILVDPLVSITPDIKLHHMGKLTYTPIVSSQLFADHSSILPSIHCHLLENFTLEETTKAKVGFERMQATYRATISYFSMCIFIFSVLFLLLNQSYTAP